MPRLKASGKPRDPIYTQARWGPKRGSPEPPNVRTGGRIKVWTFHRLRSVQRLILTLLYLLLFPLESQDHLRPVRDAGEGRLRDRNAGTCIGEESGKATNERRLSEFPHLPQDFHFGVYYSCCCLTSTSFYSTVHRQATQGRFVSRCCLEKATAPTDDRHKSIKGGAACC